MLWGCFIVVRQPYKFWGCLTSYDTSLTSVRWLHTCEATSPVFRLPHMWDKLPGWVAVSQLWGHLISCEASWKITFFIAVWSPHQIWGFLSSFAASSHLWGHFIICRAIVSELNLFEFGHWLSMTKSKANLTRPEVVWSVSIHSSIMTIILLQILNWYPPTAFG